jgi:L-amino acid N-acyltransferase YncA
MSPFDPGLPMIRDCEERDMPAIQAIYADAVLTGQASFELEPPSVDEMRRRWQVRVSEGYPFLVAEADGQISGYAYAGTYHGRPAYAWTVENSIYVDRDHRGRRVGKLLMEEIIRRCEGSGFRQMVAVIGDSGNAGSIALHRSLGFVHAGTLRSVGWKHGRWLDSVIMQRPLGPGDATAPSE